MVRRALRALIVVAPEFAAITCLVALLWFGIGTTIATQRASALEGAARDTNNLAHAFEENTQRIISSADQILLSLRAAYVKQGADFRLNEWVQRENAPDWLRAQIAIIAPDGMSIASTASAVSVSVADRKHFIVQRDSETDDVYISAPVIGRSSGRWTIQLTRKIMTEDGRFDGVVVLSLDCYQLSGFYESLNLRQGFLELVGLDGIVRARGPVENGQLGSQLAINPGEILHRVQGVIRVNRDGTDMTVAFRRLSAYPLVVLVGFNDKAVLAGARRTERVLCWSGGAATLLLVVIGVFWIRQRRRSIASQRSLAFTLQSMSQGLIMVDADRNVRVVNGRALELLGLPPILLGTLSQMGSDRVAAEAKLLQALDRQKGLRDRGDAMAHPVLEFNSTPTATGGSVETITDVTARHVADRKIRFMALHDHLTGLGNRVLFADETDHLLNRAVEHGEQYDVLCLDLNGFKKVNDTLGHDCGDAVLKEVAERLTRVIGEADLVARTGGDEFAILTRVTQPDISLNPLARLVHSILEAPFAIAGHQLRIGASIGIARFPVDGVDRTDLLRNADLALYVAKSEPKGATRRFESAMAEGARRRRQLEDDLRAAVGTDQFILEFQPQFRTANLAVVGFEALLRWEHPLLGRLGPDAFIPVAEETGMIVALGRFVLEQACAVALNWPDDVHIAVNLSPVQFRDPQIINTVQAVLSATGLPASRLELEVTEGVLIADEAQALQTLTELRQLGVTLALDDFGTGYASLSYLRKFPFEQIKLDRSFVQAQVVEERSRHILRAILSLSRNLHLSVVAEGVETRTQLHLLRKQGCHAVQGFLVGRPMSRQEAATMFPGSARSMPAAVEIQLQPVSL